MFSSKTDGVGSTHNNNNKEVLGIHSPAATTREYRDRFQWCMRERDRTHDLHIKTIFFSDHSRSPMFERAARGNSRRSQLPEDPFSSFGKSPFFNDPLFGW